MKRPHVLITNDDGIESQFLRVLVESHLPAFRVSVVAPAGEQSWIGRAFSRTREVSVCEKKEIFAGLAGVENAWAVAGTPSDCVNIGLGHLLPALPDVVISGINVGFNATMPLSLSSGTLAGAIEGAAWGLPALAYSLEMADADFERARLNKGKAHGETLESLKHAAAHAARFTREFSGKKSAGIVVQNFNFPRRCLPETIVETTRPADVRLGCVFQKEGEGAFRFRWNKRCTPFPENDDTDTACLKRGNISRTVLNYGVLGRC